MDEHMGRRTVGGLLFTKGGSILLFREDSSRRKSGACSSRLGCTGTRHSAADKGRQMHRAAAAAAAPPPPPPAPAKEAAPTPRRPQLFKKPNREPPPQGSRNAASYCSESDNRAAREAPGAGRDLLARLKDRVSASRKRSLARENSNSPSSPGGFSASSSSSSATRSASRPAHRAASRIRKADEGASAGHRHRHRSGDDGRRDSERNEDDLLLVEQAAAGDHGPSEERFLSGFLARYRSSVQGGLLPSLDDGTEDSNGYWRFDVEGTEELENYFIFSDRHRGMRMDIDGMSYEELLALGDRIGTVNTGLPEDALSKCLSRSMYMPTISETHQDCDRKCSVCQEEYLAGEEVGKMACKHYYHISCIQHWLRQKNWCPICKTVALKTK